VNETIVANAGVVVPRLPTLGEATRVWFKIGVLPTLAVGSAASIALYFMVGMSNGQALRHENLRCAIEGE
jgi:hypothetical protein